MGRVEFIYDSDGIACGYCGCDDLDKCEEDYECTSSDVLICQVTNTGICGGSCVWSVPYPTMYPTVPTPASNAISTSLDNKTIVTTNTVNKAQKISVVIGAVFVFNILFGFI